MMMRYARLTICSHRLYFGLGKEESVSSIDIQYLTGPVQTLSNPSINRVIKVER